MIIILHCHFVLKIHGLSDSIVVSFPPIVILLFSYIRMFISFSSPLQSKFHDLNTSISIFTSIPPFISTFIFILHCLLIPSISPSSPHRFMASAAPWSFSVSSFHRYVMTLTRSWFSPYALDNLLLYIISIKNAIWRQQQP